MSISMEAEKTTANPSTQSTETSAPAVSASRLWLENLTPEQCAAALSFRDGPFWGSLLDLAASSSLRRQPQQLGGTSWILNAHVGAFDLEDLTRKMSIDENEWEQTLASQGEELLTGSAEADKVSQDAIVKLEEMAEHVPDVPAAEGCAGSNDNDKQGDSEGTAEDGGATTNSGEELMEDKAKEEAEVFRIRSEVEVSAEEVSHTEPSGEDTQAKVENSYEIGVAVTEAAKEIAENIHVVPATEPEWTGDIPVVCIHPAFLKSKGTGDYIRSLDSIIQKFSPSSSFLSDFLMEVDPKDVGNLCLQRLQQLMKAASDKNAPVGLFLVLLVRLEVAAFMAFAESTSEVDKIDSSKGLDILQFERLMERLDVLERKSQAVDESTVKSIVAPLTEAGYCSLDGFEGGAAGGGELRNLLVTPLPSLLNLFASVKVSDRPSFQRWNKAWNATMQNLLEALETSPQLPDILTQPQSTLPTTPTASSNKPSTAPNTSAPTKPSSNNEAIATTSTPDGTRSNSNMLDEGTTNTPHASNTPSSNSKKNKKKNRKKRNKRKSNAGPSAGDNAGDASPPQRNLAKVQPAKDEAQKVEVIAEAEAQQVEVIAEAEETTKEDQEEVETNSAKDIAKDDAVEDVTEASRDELLAAGQAIMDETSTEALEERTAIAPTRSFDSGKFPSSDSDDTASTKTESTKHDEVKADAMLARNHLNKGDFTVSRVHGVGTVVVAPSPNPEPSQSSATEQNTEGSAEVEKGDVDNDLDEWETVEVKVRGNRKKSGRGGSQMSSSFLNGGSSPLSTSGKKAKATRSSASRKRLANRKMVKEILSSVLDSVDEEFRRRQQQEAQEARKVSPVPAAAPAQSAWKEGTRRPSISEGSKKEKTLRDIVVGEKALAVTTPKRTSPPKVDAKSNSKSPATQSSAASTRASQRNLSSAPHLKLTKVQATAADQNTAPTIPETVSAVSDPTRRAATTSEREITRSDSSSTETDYNRKQEERASVKTDVSKNASPEPPLPTLLNPGNVNSASSSVASSLEAPHAGRGHHHTSTSNEVDVGYHLLDVCDRLTRDMDVFMARRASALSTRRRERGALLGALQDSVSSIWAGHSHVELYGSCATMLDLPSSDLDVVVCGLDTVEATLAAANSPQKTMPSFSGSESITPDKRSPDPQLRHSHSIPHFVPMQLNADRVMRLAADLEHQPWAVHVKAIPTASVPVVKVLADPSRLPGATPLNVLEGEEWMMQHHHLSNQNTTRIVTPPNELSTHETSQSSGAPHYHQPAMSPAWRGADVINGLLKLDITFEGPEHGGIGSTEFSAHVMQSICDETGLPSESTAFVQVIMVVKELLAQRRLNEPFSGGLSSYALLLLVLAVMYERKVVCEELERVERQRRVVAAGGGNCEVSDVPRGVVVAEPPKGSPEAQIRTDQSKTPQTPAIMSASQESIDSKGGVHRQGTATQQTKQTTNTAPTLSSAGGNKQTAKTQAQTIVSVNKQATKCPAHPENGAQVGNQSVGSTPTGNPRRSSNAGGGQPPGVTAGGNQQRGGTVGNNQTRGPNSGKSSPLATVKDGVPRSSDKISAKSVGNSWASIAMGKNMPAQSNASSPREKEESKSKDSEQPAKPSSFADAVARNAANTSNMGTASNPTSSAKSIAPAATKAKPTHWAATKGKVEGNGNKKLKQKQTTSTSTVEEKAKVASQEVTKKSPEVTSEAKEQTKEGVSSGSVKVEEEKERKVEADEKTSKFNNYSSEPVEPATSSNQSAFPQGFNDVIEVLCSGETTPGKLLMHFLLFYGQHFDAHATAIDISGKHQRDAQNPHYTIMSPYIQRRSAGNIDPITGMLTVDPIVVYDPLEGAENNNVARRCFLWSSVKWVFAQSYMTLSSAAEQNNTPPGTPAAGMKNLATGVQGVNNQGADTPQTATWSGPYNPSDRGNLFDPSSPLLELLLSF